jgi:tetratricopeptide (TPR) repeat protein
MNTTPANTSASRLERLGRYLTVDPDNPTLLKDYAGEAWMAHEAEACLLALHKLKELDALDAEHSGLLGRALVARGDVAAAISELELALQRWPQSTLLRLELARSLFVARAFEQAMAQLPPEDSPGELGAAICALRVRLLHHGGRLDDALEAAARFEEAGGRQPGVEAALLPVLVDLGRIEDAVGRAQHLVDTQPEAVPYEAFEPLAIAALDSQQFAQSRQWVERGLQARQDDGRIWLLAALTHLQAGEGTAATEAVEQAVALMPGHAGSHLAHGWIALLRGDAAGARSAFERGIEASPAFAEGHGSLAVAEALSGHAAEADALIRKALLLDKHCASAQFAQTVRRGEPAAHVRDLAHLVLARARTSRAQS